MTEQTDQQCPKYPKWEARKSVGGKGWAVYEIYEDTELFIKRCRTKKAAINKAASLGRLKSAFDRFTRVLGEIAQEARK